MCNSSAWIPGAYDLVRCDSVLGNASVPLASLAVSSGKLVVSRSQSRQLMLWSTERFQRPPPGTVAKGALPTRHDLACYHTRTIPGSQLSCIRQYDDRRGRDVRATMG